MRTVVALLAGVMCAWVGAANARSLYVAVNGNDAWSGALAAPNRGQTDGPFATLERARDEVRRMKQQGGVPAGGVTILVRGGRYRVTRTFELETADSGSKRSPVTYRAYQNEMPVFSGGVRLTGFQAVRDAAILARLPEESRGKVVEANLKANGVTDITPLRLGGFASGLGFTTHPVMELFFNGQALPLARWPNRGFVRVARISAEDVRTDRGRTGSKTGKLIYEGDRPQRWREDKDALLYGYFFWDWADSYERIASIDTGKREITLEPPYATYGYREGAPYYAVNLLSEIDMPGEWYLDRGTGTVYLYPPSDPARAVVELSVAAFPLVRMENTSYVTLRGLTWELGGADGILIRGGDHCLVAGCTVRRCGGNAVEIGGGTAHGVRSCDLYSMGRGGVVMDGGDRRTLTPGGHSVENCEIYDLSRIDHTYTPAVVMSGVGNRISHNLLHDIRSSAIRLNGNDHLVEFNEVYGVVTESDDQGGIDMFGDPTFRGNIIRYNYWHHIGDWNQEGEEPAIGQAGVRLDDAISGVLVEGNVFYRCATGRLGFGGLQIHGGKDNVVTNNVFAQCRTAISFSPWGDKRWRDYIAKTLDGDRIDRALYLSKYPDLARLAGDHDVNTIRGNVVCDCGEFLRRDSGQDKLEDNLVTKDNPGFKAPARGVFSIAKGNPALGKIGFRPIPFEQIGLRIDEFRKRLPVAAIAQARAAGGSTERQNRANRLPDAHIEQR